jgi:hypothetical protein
MKTIKYIFISTILLFQIVLSLQAQTTEGKEFWLTFGKMYDFQNLYSNSCIEIRIVSNNQSASGSIYFTNLGTYEYFSINANDVFTYSLNLSQKDAVYNSTIGVSDRSINIVSFDAPIIVYAFIHHPYTMAEATHVLPVTALGTEYYQISHTPIILPVPPNTIFQDAYAVVATQNNTHLYHNGDYLTTINLGQVYYKTSNTDMTGNCITSNNPVAFFSVHQLADIPPGGYSSPLFEQMAPVNTWGKKFIVPVTNFEKDIIRIVASRNDTDIEVFGGTIRTGVPGAQNSLTNLQSGDFVELDFTNDYKGCYIQSNNPIGVCSYISNYQYTGFSSSPSQSWVPALGQLSNKTIIAPFIPIVDNHLKLHYALVITPTATKEQTMVSIGGTPSVDLSGEIWKDNIDANMSFCNKLLSQNNASYIFTNPNGIIILGYATGNVFLQFTTYYYLAGSAMRDLDAAFYANDIHFMDLKDSPFCEGNVVFLAEIEGVHSTHPERIKWFINDSEEITERNKLEWSKYFSAGNYEIRMDVIYENLESTSKIGTLIIKSCNQSATFYKNEVHYLTDTTFCNKNLNFRAEIDGLHPTHPERIRWYVDGIEETSALNLTEWGRPFENGTYEIKMVVRYDNDETVIRTGTLKVQALWIKMRNIRY